MSGLRVVLQRGLLQRTCAIQSHSRSQPVNLPRHQLHGSQPINSRLTLDTLSHSNRITLAWCMTNRCHKVVRSWNSSTEDAIQCKPVLESVAYEGFPTVSTYRTVTTGARYVSGTLTATLCTNQETNGSETELN